eukprot:scaffold5570_cov18-Tisochrysis_lutea.AAC.1
MLAREAGHTDFMCDAWSHAQVLSRKAVASTQTARHDQVMQHNGFKEKAHSSPANVVMYVLTLKVLLAKTLCIQAGVHTKHAHLFPCKNSIVVLGRRLGVLAGSTCCPIMHARNPSKEPARTSMANGLEQVINKLLQLQASWPEWATWMATWEVGLGVDHPRMLWEMGQPNLHIPRSMIGHQPCSGKCKMRRPRSRIGYQPCSGKWKVGKRRCSGQEA